MIYNSLGSTGVEVSAIGLGGHEFYPDGSIRGFADDFKRSVTRGEIMEGFGGENRRRIVERALELGITLFDVTMDSEKDALGRVFADVKPPDNILIQTRPEGMVYNYDPENRQMAQYDLVEKEVARICGLLRRDHIDIFNFAFMKTALDADPAYLDKIGDIVRRLKEKGLIGFASADTFSGESTYLTQFRSGHFDTTFINYNLLDDAMNERVIPEASGSGLAILSRESFKKGRVFSLAEEAGITDRALIARTSLKWILSNPHLSSTVVGVSSREQLEENAAVLQDLELTEEEQSAIDTLRSSPGFADAREEIRASFMNQA